MNEQVIIKRKFLCNFVTNETLKLYSTINFETLKVNSAVVGNSLEFEYEFFADDTKFDEYRPIFGNYVSGENVNLKYIGKHNGVECYLYKLPDKIIQTETSISESGVWTKQQLTHFNLLIHIINSSKFSGLKIARSMFNNWILRGNELNIFDKLDI
jgi:hypothetical protein